MNGTFSGIVRLTNVSDYILPSQGCIIPLKKEEGSKRIQEVEIRDKSGVKRTKITPEEQVKISLNDCLACNGCVTTAETLLIDSQTTEEMLRGITETSVSVITLSPQTIASIAHHRNLSIPSTAIFISAFFKSKGATYVIDSSFGRLISLEESWKEFRDVFVSNKRPVICSVCPGFVCYAEKTHGKTLVSLLSKIRSPQAMNALLAKVYFANKHNLKPSDIYHVSIMPCYDKKLEASRSDFLLENNVKEVDCVIGTSELNDLLDNFEYDFQNADKKMEVSWLNRLEAGLVLGGGDDSSGGYADYIVNRCLSTIFADRQIQLKEETKSKDLNVTEVIDSSTGQILLTVAKIFGFKNIQNIVQKLKRSKCTYDYLEVMACPSGCGNGGGQIRAESVAARSANLLGIQALYSSIAQLPDASLEMKQLLKDWSPDYTFFNTSFHIIDTNVMNLNAVSNMF
uniref:Fe_hyd_lg_C domain-containing protein n=1 Tax=Rhabditophanes sp. KR3021 TaxID=114890 RepID=A0AC35U1E6_9BILA